MTELTSESINKSVDSYLLDVLPERDELLQRMEQYALERDFPLVGPLAGNLMSQYTRMIKAKRILDLGSGFGFSAIHFARAIPGDGEVLCVDDSEENRTQAAKFLEEGGVLQKIRFHGGDALELLANESEPFDLIFCDIYKEQYPDAFKLGWPRIRKGGIFIADNVLWHGRVMTDDDHSSTQGIREFTKLIFNTPDAQSSIIPLRDGLSVSLKL